MVAVVSAIKVQHLWISEVRWAGFGEIEELYMHRGGCVEELDFLGIYCVDFALVGNAILSQNLLFVT